MENCTPFYNLTNIELGNLNIPPVIKKVDCMNELLNLRNLRSNYNFPNIFKSTDTSDTNSMQDLVNCDYYDPEEFKNLLNTLPKRSFSICHSNIRSIQLNVNKLQNLIANHKHLFDVFSLTETWDDVNKRNEFLPDLLDGYQPFNGIPGYSQNSG